MPTGLMKKVWPKITVETLFGFTENVVVVLVVVVVVVLVVGDPMTPEQSKEQEPKKNEEERRRTKARPSLKKLLEGHDC